MLTTIVESTVMIVDKFDRSLSMTIGMGDIYFNPTWTPGGRVKWPLEGFC